MNKIATLLLVISKGAFAVSLGALVTLCLFYIMQALIERGEKVITKVENIQMVDLIRVKEERHVQVKKRKADKPPDPDELPPTPQPAVFKMVNSDPGFHLVSFAPNTNLEIGLTSYAASDRDYLPIVKVFPAYPQRAAVKSLVGWVLVEFTVTAQGAVIDVVVIDNCATVSVYEAEKPCDNQPNRIFDKVAVKAALKFKYVPKTIDGVTIDTIGVRNLFTFVFDE